MRSIKFVDVGEGIQEGKIQKWLVKDGDVVREDQPLVQIETDKAVVNIPAPVGGTIRINAPEGKTVNVGDDIAFVGEAAEITATTTQQKASTQKSEVAATKPATRTAAENPPSQETKEVAQNVREIIATPGVRKLARDSGIDISKVHGTGPNGRILESDIRSMLHVTAQVMAPTPKFSEILEEKHGHEIYRVQMSQTRKAIARNMELSWTIPRAVHMDLIDATHLFDIVSMEKANAEKLGTKLTFLPFIIKAVVEALKENPNFNSSYDRDKQELIVKKYYNIGLAAEAPDGLKVVVIKDADRKSIVEIAKEIQLLHGKIKDQTITLDEMRDSTFTITNIGSLGGGYLSVPMINYPEAAILGVHMIRDAPVVKDGKVAVGKVLPFSITFDHRIVDGAEAVAFGNALIRYLQDPEFLEMLG